MWKCNISAQAYTTGKPTAIRWNDRQIGIEWPLREVIISEKDEKAQTLAEWLASPKAQQFVYPARAVNSDRGSGWWFANILTDPFFFPRMDTSAKSCLALSCGRL